MHVPEQEKKPTSEMEEHETARLTKKGSKVDNTDNYSCTAATDDGRSTQVPEFIVTKWMRLSTERACENLERGEHTN